MAPDDIKGEQMAIQQRDDKGRFLPGWAGGPGRPTRARELQYLRLFRQAVTPDVALEIIDAAIEKAIAGDPQARKFLFDYLVGPPAQAILTEIQTTYDPATDTRVSRIARIITQLGIDDEESQE